MPTGYRIARFIRFYGMDYYRSAIWPTRDQVIPFKVFALFEAAIGNVAAFEKLQMVQAVAHGYGIAMSGSSSLVESQTKKLTAQAFPQVTLDDGIS